jgi:hypothetical protein
MHFQFHVVGITIADTVHKLKLYAWQSIFEHVSARILVWMIGIIMQFNMKREKNVFFPCAYDIQCIIEGDLLPR